MADQLLEYRAPTPGEEPECEVLVDGVWLEGFVRGWYRYPDRWEASVQYSARHHDGYPTNHLATFPADQIRQIGDGS